MTGTRLDVVAIGDAIVDVIATCDDAFLDEEGLVKGSMQVLDADGATRLYAEMGQARETSGGSAANTHGGSRGAGRPAGFVGQVADDQLGEIFAHDMRALGVEFDTPPLKGGAADRALPDPRHARRAADDEHLPGRRARADRRRARPGADQRRRRSSISKAICGARRGRARRWSEAMRIAHEAGRKVAFTLSDIACIAPHRAEMMAMIDAGAIDLLFANEDEIRELADLRRPRLGGGRDPGQGAAARRHLRRRRRARGRGRPDASRCRSPGSAQAWSTRPAPATCSPPASSSARRAAASLEDSLRIGAIAAAEVISHFGARPEADLKALVEAL